MTKMCDFNECCLKPYKKVFLFYFLFSVSAAVNRAAVPANIAAAAAVKYSLVPKTTTTPRKKCDSSRGDAKHMKYQQQQQHYQFIVFLSKKDAKIQQPQVRCKSSCYSHKIQKKNCKK